MGALVYHDRIVNPVFPTSYFGSLAYFKALVQHDTVIIEAKEHFPKQSLRNRCKINAANGVIDLSVPVIKSNGSKTPIDEIIVDDSKDWRAIHWKSIESAYHSSPYFEHYEREIKELLFNSETNLLILNKSITQKLLSLVDLSIEIRFSSTYLLSDYPEHAQLVDKHYGAVPITAPYIQVFPGSERYLESISILDALFCEGPMLHKTLLSS